MTSSAEQGFHISRDRALDESDLSLDQLEPVLLENREALRAEQELDEGQRARRVRRVVEDRDRVPGRVVRAQGWCDRRQMGGLGLDRVKETGVKLTGLQPSEKCLLGEDLRRVLGRAENRLREAREVLCDLHPVQELDRELSLRIDRRISAAQQKPWRLQYLPPSLRFERGGEAAARVVADNERRGSELAVPAHPVAVAGTEERVVHARRGADEHVALLELALDLARDRLRAGTKALVAIPGRLRKRRPDLLLHHTRERARIHHRDRSAGAVTSCLRRPYGHAHHCRHDGDDRCY